MAHPRSSPAGWEWTRQRRWDAACGCLSTSRTTPISGRSPSTSGARAGGTPTSIYIKLSSGVGAGLLLGGRLHEGAGGTAGEIGHTPAQQGTAICRCGSRGCLETVASARAIAEQLGASRGEPVSTQELLRLTAEGDPAAARLIAEAGREIGVALAGLCNLINPDCVIIGGDLSAAGELITEPVFESIRRYAITNAAEQVTVVAGVLGERAELLGALALVLHAGDGVLAPTGSPQEVAA